MSVPRSPLHQGWTGSRLLIHLFNSEPPRSWIGSGLRLWSRPFTYFVLVIQYPQWHSQTGARLPISRVSERMMTQQKNPMCTAVETTTIGKLTHRNGFSNKNLDWSATADLRNATYWVAESIQPNIGWSLLLKFGNWHKSTDSRVEHTPK